MRRQRRGDTHRSQQPDRRGAHEFLAQKSEQITQACDFWARLPAYFMSQPANSLGAQLQNVGGQILTAPARVNPMPIISSAIPSAIKQSKPGRLAQDAYSALTLDWDEGSQGHISANCAIPA